MPDYQRGYAWEPQHRRDFLEDLEDLADDRDHYTGTLVLHPQPKVPRFVDEEGKSYAHVHVVDGQQRLTTIVVLLDAIARELAMDDAGKTLAAGTRKGYIAVRDGWGQGSIAFATSTLQAWFTGSVLAETPTPAAPRTAPETRLMLAREEFATYLADRRKVLGADYLPWLRGMRAKITGHLKLTVYEVGDSAEVGMIFEAMNNRGRPLTEFEKVKNYVLYLSTRFPEGIPTETLRQETNRAWAEVFENLMAAGLGSAEHEERLLRAHWLATRDHDARRWEGSRSIKGRYNLKRYRDRPKDLLADLLDYVRTLRDASIPYRDVYAPGHSSAFARFGTKAVISRAQAWGEKLLQTWVTAPFLPVLIAARLREPLDGDRCVELLSLCERYGFRIFRLGGFRANTGLSALHALAFARYHQKVDHAGLLAEIRALLLRYQPETAFAARLAEKPRDDENNWYEWSGLRYMLYEWEEHCAGKETVRIPWSAIAGLELEKTVEHVLPQTPTNAYWQASFTEAERKRYTHDLGNLCLTSHNGTLGNRGFVEKKGAPGDKGACYENSLLASEHELWGVATWNAGAAVQARQRASSGGLGARALACGQPDARGGALCSRSQSPPTATNPV